jgi:hypothetical protein
MFRKSITGGLLQVQLIRTLEAPDGNTARAEELAQVGFEIPCGAGDAAKQIQAERTVFGKGVAGEVGLRKEAEAGDSASAGELVPLGLPDGPEIHFTDDSRK